MLCEEEESLCVRGSGIAEYAPVRTMGVGFPMEEVGEADALGTKGDDHSEVMRPTFVGGGSGEAWEERATVDEAEEVGESDDAEEAEEAGEIDDAEEAEEAGESDDAEEAEEAGGSEEAEEAGGSEEAEEADFVGKEDVLSEEEGRGRP